MLPGAKVTKHESPSLPEVVRPALRFLTPHDALAGEISPVFRDHRESLLFAALVIRVDHHPVVRSSQLVSARGAGRDRGRCRCSPPMFRSVRRGGGRGHPLDDPAPAGRVDRTLDDETFNGSIEMSGNNIVANDNFGAGPTTMSKW